MATTVVSKYGVPGFGCVVLLMIGWAAAADREKPVTYVAKHAYTLRTAQGDVSLPMEYSVDMTGEHGSITRAVIVFHGKGRNVEGYYHALELASHAGGPNAAKTLLMAPQFLREEDIDAHRLPAQFLRWRAGGWSAGEDAAGPYPVSSFSIIDALLAALGDRRQFPHLDTIVLIGHSGGGQLLNRYAIVGTEPAALAAAGVHVRFVIANPSSFFYFSDDRPQKDGTFAPFAAPGCPKFNHWRYGPIDPPSYVADSSQRAWDEREQAYSAADVVYLLGTSDDDPHQADLDTSCAGEAEGPERLDRGKNYFRYLMSRHRDLRQQLWFVPGVAHVGSRMVDSECAIAASFDYGRCATGSGDPLRR